MNYYPAKRAASVGGAGQSERTRSTARRKREPSRTARGRLGIKPIRVPQPRPAPQPLMIQPMPITDAIGTAIRIAATRNPWVFIGREVAIALLREAVNNVPTDPDPSIPNPGAPAAYPLLTWTAWASIEVNCSGDGYIWSGTSTTNCSANRSPIPGPTVTWTSAGGGQTLIRWDRLGKNDPDNPLDFIRFKERYLWRQRNPSNLPLETLWPDGLPMVPPATVIPPLYGRVPRVPQPSRLGEEGQPSNAPRPRGRRARRPPRFVKEKKAALHIRGTFADKLMNIVTESLDVLNCAHSALPRKYQAKPRYDAGGYGGQGRWRRATPQRIAMTVYQNLGHLNVGKFVQCLIQNQVEDYLIGKVGQLTAKANQKRGSFAGAAFGPAL